MPDKNKLNIKETPLMRQYNAIKARHRDTILFFRMGDFYEMFNEDAGIAAKVLGITLTSRGHGKTGDIPLAGFPYHALDGYLARMIRAGYKVAICEQIEDPKTAQGIVKRDVVQIVTPGTVIEEALLETKRNNYLTAIYQQDDLTGLALADVSTGEFRVTEIKTEVFNESLEAINPSELLVPEEQTESIKEAMKIRAMPIITKLDQWVFSHDYAMEVLTRHFKTSSLKGFGCENLSVGISAAGALLHYLQETQKTDLSYVRNLKPYSDSDYMNLDAATRRNLEIVQNMSGINKNGTLLSILDHTRTPMGGRTLAAWVQRPLNQLEPIKARLMAVKELIKTVEIKNAQAQHLKGFGDLERLITRVVTKRANPRDLQALGRFLNRIPAVKKDLSEVFSPMLIDIRTRLEPCEELTTLLLESLVDNPPASLGDGGLFKTGYNSELDELRELTISGKEWIARLQAQERERTGISSLKVGFNRVFGYYLEITKTHQDKVPDDYIRKQTLVNSERYITPDLKAKEEKILSADEKMAALERSLFEELRAYAASFSAAIQTNGSCLGILDSLLSLAEAAEIYRYVEPKMDESGIIDIRDGRHPVVEQLLNPGDPFIPNDVSLSNDEEQLLIITGPNMAGKSTYIRQVGLIVLMAQMGGFVPAASARIGVVDRIFTRVGAQDNLAAGESTFLVEMNETANILNNATSKSLILLDEIGRGTSTFDGLSIAWAVAEFLIKDEKVQAKTLFATHYHELTELSIVLPRVKNLNVAVKEWGDHIVFLRKIVPGGCDHSYGIQVARLAGLPDEIIQRAREVLHNLEENELTPNEMPKLAQSKGAHLKVAEQQLNIFARQETRLGDMLRKIDINKITPLEALQFLNELKDIIE